MPTHTGGHAPTEVTQRRIALSSIKLWVFFFLFFFLQLYSSFQLMEKEKGTVNEGKSLFQGESVDMTQQRVEHLQHNPIIHLSHQHSRQLTGLETTTKKKGARTLQREWGQRGEATEVRPGVQCIFHLMQNNDSIDNGAETETVSNLDHLFC